MGLSDLFIDPESLPDGPYGLIQLCTLLVGYGRLSDPPFLPSFVLFLPPLEFVSGP
jgi:hypothetical protein